jgi:hypothetical protein
MMSGPYIIDVLIEAEVVTPGINLVSIVANANGYYSITVEGAPTAQQPMGDELNRLRQIAQLAAKMVKLQLEDGQVDNALAEQVKALISG